MILIFISILNHTQTGTHFSTLKTLWIKYLEQNASFIPLSRGTYRTGTEYWKNLSTILVHDLTIKNI